MTASVPGGGGGRITRGREGGSLVGGIRHRAARGYRAGVLDRVRRWVWGLSGRLIASYILVTLAVVVLVEALVLGIQVPSLVNAAQLQAQVDATARSYGQQLSERVPTGTVLGEPRQPARPGQARPGPDGTLAVPAITGPIHSRLAVTA